MVSATHARQTELLEDNSTDEVKEESDKPTRRGNIFMRKLEPEMLSNPYPMEVADGMPSDEFCYEKTLREIIRPLNITTVEEWIEFGNKVWQWQEEAENREIEARVQAILRQLDEDPKAKERLAERLLPTKTTATAKR